MSMTPELWLRARDSINRAEAAGVLERVTHIRLVNKGEQQDVVITLIPAFDYVDKTDAPVNVRTYDMGGSFE